MKRKAQIWSFDFAVSVVIFVTVLIIVIFFWSYTNFQSFEQIELERIQDNAVSVSDILIRSSGVPENWTNETVTIIGLAASEKILDQNKIVQFMQIPYMKAKTLLGIGNNEFYFTIAYANDSVVTISGDNATIGLSPSNSSIIVIVERYVLLNGEIVKAKMHLWSS